MTAFSNFRDKKANQHQLPDDVRGVVCETSGSDPKSYCCNNKNGVRCSPDFQGETDTCPGAGCPRRRSARFRWKALSHEVIGPCKTNGDVQKRVCPQPCGCVLDGQPKRESKSIVKTETIHGECGSTDVTNKMLKKLKSWGVPESVFINYEMGIFGDSSQFTVFDLFIQPKENEARYSLAIGASRCHHNAVEIGYMYTGMWKVDMVNNYKCHWKGGCSGIGIPEENIDKARKALEWYAWKDVNVDLLRFDCGCYLGRYSDLRAAFGSNCDRAFDHWIEHGHSEKRNPWCRRFDCGCYLARYSDLRAAFGSNCDRALDHWIEHGRSEKRNPGCIP